MLGPGNPLGRDIPRGFEDAQHATLQNNFLDVVRRALGTAPYRDGILEMLLLSNSTIHNIDVRFSHFLEHRKLDDGHFHCDKDHQCLLCQVFYASWPAEGFTWTQYLGFSHDEILQTHMSVQTLTFPSPIAVTNFIQLLNPETAKGVKNMRLNFSLEYSESSYGDDAFDRLGGDFSYELRHCFYMISLLPSLKNLDIRFEGFFLESDYYENFLDQLFDGAPVQTGPLDMAGRAWISAHNVLEHAGISDIRGLQEVSLSIDNAAFPLGTRRMKKKIKNMHKRTIPLLRRLLRARSHDRQATDVLDEAQVVCHCDTAREICQVILRKAKAPPRHETPGMITYLLDPNRVSTTVSPLSLHNSGEEEARTIYKTGGWSLRE